MLEIPSVGFDFIEYLDHVLRKHEHDDRVTATSRGAARVFRNSYGSGDGAGV